MPGLKRLQDRAVRVCFVRAIRVISLLLVSELTLDLGSPESVSIDCTPGAPADAASGHRARI
jgi:hypothetical protein